MRAVRGAMLRHLKRENEPDLRPRFRLMRQMDHVDEALVAIIELDEDPITPGSGT